MNKPMPDLCASGCSLPPSVRVGDEWVCSVCADSLLDAPVKEQP